MPELPEVETVRKQLAAVIKPPQVVRRIEFFRPDLRFKIPRQLKAAIEGQSLQAIERRAKYLIFRFAGGSMLSHLGMTGAWREVFPGEERQLHDHVRLTIARGVGSPNRNDDQVFVFNDPRRFGYLDWIAVGSKRNQRLVHLGPEPLSEEFSADNLKSRLRGRKISVKVAIMDQKIVVGVGNIYASEALFRAGVRPTRLAGKVTAAECHSIVAAIKSVLQEAIDAGGSTISDYRHPDGNTGAFQVRFSVYDRKGEACLACGHAVVAKTIGGRSTYWCRRCQR